MKSINLIAIGVLIFCTGVFSPSIGQSQKETYCNNRFSFCLEYPSQLFSQKVPSTNGDGLELHSSDGKVILNVSGINNVLSNTIEEEFELFKEYLKNQEKEFKIFSSVIEAGQFIVYASSGNEVYYQKTILEDTHVVNIFILSKLPSFDQSKMRIETVANDLVLLVQP